VKIPFKQLPTVGHNFIDLGPEVAAAILRTLEVGWQIACQSKQVNTSAMEVAITECLRNGMREALCKKSLPWHRTMVILPGAESKSKPSLSAPDGRTDIPLFFIEVFLRSGEHDPHAIIECKRVAEGDAKLAREYVIEGIDRFRLGKYGWNHSRGFMAGYVIAGTSTGVVKQINKYLEGRYRAPEQLTPASLNGWMSKHPRPSSKKSVELHHAMLLVPAA
jgi:hypothetical protein